MKAVKKGTWNISGVCFISSFRSLIRHRVLVVTKIIISWHEFPFSNSFWTTYDVLRHCPHFRTRSETLLIRSSAYKTSSHNTVSFVLTDVKIQVTVLSTKTECDYVNGCLKTVTYAQISPKMVNPRDRGGERRRIRRRRQRKKKKKKKKKTLLVLRNEGKYSRHISSMIFSRQHRSQSRDPRREQIGLKSVTLKPPLKSNTKHII